MECSGTAVWDSGWDVRGRHGTVGWRVFWKVSLTADQKAVLESGRPWANGRKDSDLGCGWEGCGQHSVGSVTLQTFSSQNFGGMKLLEPFLGLIPRV